jgi:serine/threonine protein kinase
MILQPGSRPVPNSPDYVLVRKLGAGAFGQVWHAHGPGGLDVALKFIPHVPAHELRSLDAMKSIRHPNLVSLFGVWHKDDWLILAMERCDRSLLEQLWDCMVQPNRAVLACPKCEQKVRVPTEHDRLRLTCPICRHGWDWAAPLPGIPLDELLPYMNDAASGLDALNSKQVQHRDVKPANLLLLNGGVKVADFGLAKALEHTVASNSVAGTLAYTAPESFKGQLAQQSDQYSLAVTYFHLRTGRLLFDGDQAKVMYGHLELKPDLSCLPLAEEVVLARALSKEPAKRWQDCRTLVSRLVSADPKEAERRRQQSDRQKPRSEPAEAQQAKPAAPIANEWCWFCKTNEANGKPARVKLRFGLEHKTTIDVARCVPCEHRQRNHKLLVFCLAAAVIVLGAWGVWTLADPDPPYEFKFLRFSLIWFISAGPVIFMLANDLLLKLQQRTVANFPQTKAKLNAGWRIAPFW